MGALYSNLQNRAIIIAEQIIYEDNYYRQPIILPEFHIPRCRAGIIFILYR